MEGEQILIRFISWTGLNTGMNTGAIHTRLWTESYLIKQAILLNIAAIITDHKAGIAVPTCTLHLHQEPGYTPVQVPAGPGTS